MHIRRLLAVALAGLAATICVSSAQATATVTYRASYGFSGPAGLYAYGLDFDPSNGGSILVGDLWLLAEREALGAKQHGMHQSALKKTSGPSVAARWACTRDSRQRKAGSPSRPSGGARGTAGG